MSSVSAVIPVYNSEGTLPSLVDRVRATLSAHATGWELILVNDGSSDGSWSRIERLAAADPRVRGVDLAGNFGQHNALLAGIEAAAHPVIVTLDDDLQNPPEEIPKLLDALNGGHDVVYGVPVEKRHAFHRRVSARAFRRAVSAIDGSVAPRLVTSFRALRAEATRDLGRRHGRHVSLDRLLRRSTNRFASVGVRHDPRLAGRSNYTLTMLARHAISELGRNVHVRPKTERQLSFAVSRMTPARSPARLNGRR